jgi:hypothetical protein
MNASKNYAGGWGRAAGEDPSAPSSISRLLYHKCSFDESGDRKCYERALSLPSIHLYSFIDSRGWRITVDRRKGEECFALINKRPLEPGNLYEVIEVWEGDKFLPPMAFE